MNFEAIILAAGFSSRANGFKMEFEIEGKPLIQRTIEAFYDTCTRIIVVGGYCIEKIEAMTKGYSKVEVVCNHNFVDGMFSSVKTGVRNIKGDKFFVTPGDYPLISKELIARMAAFDKDILVPTFENRKGHPVLIDKSLKEEILAFPDDKNLKLYFDTKKITLIESKDSGVIIDIDTQRDLEKVKNIQSNKL